MFIPLYLTFISLIVLTEARAPLIAYTGQPVELSDNGLRSVEAGKAAKYAAQQILDERLKSWNLPPCVAAVPEIIYGSSKVIAGIEYNLNLRMAYRRITVRDRDPRCRTAIEHFQDEECRVSVAYQPYKPSVAKMALLGYQCHEPEFNFPEAHN